MVWPRNVRNFYWHEHNGARILLPLQLSVTQPFPELCAESKEELLWIVVVITSDQTQRELAEMDFLPWRLPRSTPPDNEVEIIRNGAISSPYPGQELICQVHTSGNPVPGYDLRRLMYLNHSSGIIANIRIGGEGLFAGVESCWQTALDSFYWNPDGGVVLKFDGDEIVHRARYKKKITRARPPVVPVLPTRLRYLQPVIDELISLPSEEVNEDLDMSSLEKLLRKRIEGLSLRKAEKRLKADYTEISEWIKQNPHGSSSGTFILGFIDMFIISLGGLDNLRSP